MDKRKYRYIYAVYTDNLCWGRMLIGRADNRAVAEYMGVTAGKGCFIVKRERKYND